MNAVIETKRLGYGHKWSKTSKLVFAIVDPITKQILENAQGPLVFSNNPAGLDKAREAIKKLK